MPPAPLPQTQEISCRVPQVWIFRPGRPRTLTGLLFSDRVPPP
jgi:hypothetical protein